jgi:preprotein translocase subunit SecE
MAGIVGYIKEAYTELKENITWTPWAEAQNLTIIVAIFSVVFALMIAGVDVVIQKAITGFFNLVK